MMRVFQEKLNSGEILIILRRVDGTNKGFALCDPEQIIKESQISDLDLLGGTDPNNRDGLSFAQVDAIYHIKRMYDEDERGCLIYDTENVLN